MAFWQLDYVTVSLTFALTHTAPGEPEEAPWQWLQEHVGGFPGQTVTQCDPVCEGSLLHQTTRCQGHHQEPIPRYGMNGSQCSRLLRKNGASLQ